MKLIFLDIDGVLNGHEDIHQTGIHTISPAKVRILNHIVRASSAQIVLSSAWRYMILGGAMTLDGFRYMLSTYGLNLDVKLHGHTVSDEEIPERGDQIIAYLASVTEPVEVWIVLDDASPTMAASLFDRCGDHWLPVDGTRGLDDDVADAAITALNAKKQARPATRATGLDCWRDQGYLLARYPTK